MDEKIIELLKMPKIEIGLTEKRTLAQYETKEYTARLWIPLNSKNINYEDIFDDLQDAITIQQLKDKIKPTRELKKSMIKKAFEKVENNEKN